jgi:hypothetical protein
VSGFALRPRLAFLTLRPRLPALALRTDFARLAFFARRPLLAFFALLALFTVLSFLTGFALVAGWSVWSDRARFTLRPRNTSLTIAAILQFRQACVDALDDLGAKLGDLGAQRRDDARRLCLDQRALTLPLLTFTVEHLGECFPPDVKQTVAAGQFDLRC